MKMIDIVNLHVVALAGGVGGAKLVDGLSQVLPADNLTVIANTGDDFEHLGLTICPDLDTLMYTLAGQANPDTGWGRLDESWRTHEEIQNLGGPAWFKLGDRDLATHLVRTEMLSRGHTLSEATHYLSKKFAVPNLLLPMSDQTAPTMIDTDEGLLSFQSWFVERSWQPEVREVCLPADVRASSGVVAALENANVAIIAPSNPFVSIDPILNVYPIREMITDLPELVIGVSPIIGGRAVKGPAAKMMVELGLEASAAAVAHHYDPLLDVFIFDGRDDIDLTIPDLHLHQTNIMMNVLEDRRTLASEIIDLAVKMLAA